MLRDLLTFLVILYLILRLCLHVEIKLCEILQALSRSARNPSVPPALFYKPHN